MYQRKLYLIVPIVLAMVAAIVIFIEIVDSNVSHIPESTGWTSKPINVYTNSNVQSKNNTDLKSIPAYVPLREKIELNNITRVNNTWIAHIKVQDRVKPYRKGDIVAQGIMIAKIDQEQVYLVEEREFERLILSEPKIGSLRKGIFNLFGPTHSTTSSIPSNIRFPNGVESRGIEKLQENQFLINRNLINKQLSKGYIFKHAIFKPDEKGGFIIEDIAKGSVYDKLGLQRGDAIREINGKPLTSFTDVIGFYKVYMEYDQAQIKVSRGGNDRHIYLLMN